MYMHMVCFHLHFMGINIDEGPLLPTLAVLGDQGQHIPSSHPAHSAAAARP